MYVPVVLQQGGVAPVGEVDRDRLCSVLVFVFDTALQNQRIVNHKHRKTADPKIPTFIMPKRKPRLCTHRKGQRSHGPEDRLVHLVEVRHQVDAQPLAAPAAVAVAGRARDGGVGGGAEEVGVDLLFVCICFIYKYDDGVECVWIDFGRVGVSIYIST